MMCRHSWPRRVKMARKIFINYRRDDSRGIAGRLQDRLAQAFGRKNVLVGVDRLSGGVDFEVHQNNQVAACQAFVTVIGPNWLDAKDEAGQRLLHHPEHSFAIEISVALARNIRVVPVLVDGARMPNESELPESLKALARCQAVEVRQVHFDRDAEALVEGVRKALNGGSVGLRSWRGRAVAGVAGAAGLLLVGWIGIHHIPVWPPWAKMRESGISKPQAEAEAKRKSAEAEQQRLETFNAEQERQASAAAEAEAKRKSEEAEQQRLAALRAEEERNRAEAEALARYSSLIIQADTDYKAGHYEAAIANYNEAIRLDPKSAQLFINRGNAYKNKRDHDRAIADFNDAIRLDPKSALAFRDRGDAYTNKGDPDRAIADFNEAIRLDPKSAHAFRNRGVVYAYKGDEDRAIADFDEAIRLDPKSALSFRNRGEAYANKSDNDRAIADFNEAIRLDPKSALALSSRGVAYGKKGDYDRAIADFNEAIRLDPKSAHAFRNRGVVFAYKGDDYRAVADFNEAIRLDPNDALAYCNRGMAKRNINDMSGNEDIAKSRRLGRTMCR